MAAFLTLSILMAGLVSSLNSATLEFHPSKQSLRKPTSSSLDDLWRKYLEVHNKKYTGEELLLRRRLWEDSVQVIATHNLEYDLGLHSFTLGVNEFADWTEDEYAQLRGFRSDLATRTGKPFLFEGSEEDLPKTVDWREHGYVTPIKNQGACGSCWAFSSTGALEGQHKRVSGQLVSLSEQNLIDCTKKYGNAGCNGGWMDNAFKYVQENDGIDTEAYYPYEAHDDWCGYDPAPEHKGANCTGHVDIPKADEDALKKAVATVGPIAVAIDATHQSFQLYRSGVYDETACSNKSTDHAVLVVGYGTLNGQDYWLVKNSWGTSWGMNGYIMMSRNKNNQCAIASFASYPTE